MFGRQFICFVFFYLVEVFQKHNATCCVVGTIDKYDALNFHVGFIMFQPMLKKLLNIEQFFLKFFLNFYREFGYALGIVEEPLLSKI